MLKIPTEPWFLRWCWIFRGKGSMIFEDMMEDECWVSERWEDDERWNMKIWRFHYVHVFRTLLRRTRSTMSKKTFRKSGVEISGLAGQVRDKFDYMHPRLWLLWLIRLFSAILFVGSACLLFPTAVWSAQTSILFLASLLLLQQNPCPLAIHSG